jgi:hypothetical protein
MSLSLSSLGVSMDYQKVIEWQKNHPEKVKAYKKKWRDNHKAENREKAQKYYIENRERIYSLNARRRKEIRNEIFEILGNQCSNPNCPIPKEKMDRNALQIDHVKGNGVREVKNLNNYSRYLLHVREEIKKDSKKYQLLCAYCNWLKRYSNSEMRKHELK